MTDQKLRILLPEGSSVQAREVMLALGRAHSIDVMDPGRFCQARFSRFLGRWYRCPPYSRDPAGYLEFLFERVREGGYDVLLPTHEQTYLLSRFREPLSRHVGLAVPEFAAIHQMHSKAEFARLLEKLDLPAPETRIVGSRQEVVSQTAFPCFIKLDYSTAGTGVRRVQDPAELERVVEEIQSEGWLEGSNELLIQRSATGVQSAYSAIFQHGRFVGGLGQEILRPGVGGWGMNGESIDHPGVEQHVRRLGEHLRWHGPLFVDYFFDHQRQLPQYIECNPRMSGVLFARLCGVEMATHLLRISRGQEVKPLPPARPGVRYHHGFLMLMSLAIQGAPRRRLAAELLHAWRGQGVYAHSTNTLNLPREDWMSAIPTTAVTLLLLARPRAAHRLYQRAVANYSLTESAARTIRKWSQESVEADSIS